MCEVVGGLDADPHTVLYGCHVSLLWGWSKEVASRYCIVHWICFCKRKAAMNFRVSLSYAVGPNLWITEQPKARKPENSVSVTETVSVSSSSVTSSGGGDDDEQALLERMAKREERRQKRMMEALEREKDQNPGNDGNHGSGENSVDERSVGRRGRYQDHEEEVEERNSRKDEKEEEEEAAPEEEEAEQGEEEEEEEVVEEKPRRSYMREQVNEKQNGGLHEEIPPKHKKTERTLSRGSVRSPEAGTEEQDDAARLEAELKLEELKRRRDDAESEEFERMRQKQQEAEQELEELKKKREERRKIIEEEERQKKQEEAEKKAREEEEKRRMKEEIERRRAEAAEKRQQMGVETVDGEAKPFKCFSPRGSSLKIGERAEFLNKSAQKSTVKTSHSPVVSKIDNRLEQYTSVAQNKDMRSPRSGAVDLPMVTDGIRNIKSMWEKGNVFNSPGGGGGTYKEAAGMKIGVAGRINDWLNKTPESKTPGGRPALSTSLPGSPSLCHPFFLLLDFSFCLLSHPCSQHLRYCTVIQPNCFSVSSTKILQPLLELCVLNVS
ncbi:caldesmon 1a isoform X6 [Coregonus clupeaformis]|uniref:caldesmon 1a isoform X6 n=1 Tax=Coregonus clupeaformis TaxID=59861 RepID=UPI001E1C50C1|nr:caldesmon 1a isoform X6 [Coregonus clupeaformis]